MNEIRVPAKVVRYWTELATEESQDAICNTSLKVSVLLFCGLDDGRVYQSVKVPCSKGPQDGLPNYTRGWSLHTPAIPDR